MEQRSYGFTVSDIRAALPSYPGMVTSSDCSGDVLEEHRPEPSAANSMGKQHPYHSAPLLQVLTPDHAVRGRTQTGFQEEDPEALTSILRLLQHCPSRI